MKSVLVLEIKMAARRLWGVLFLAAFTLFFYGSQIPSVPLSSLEDFVTAGPRLVASFGEWGRYSLAILWNLGGVHSLFVSLYVVASLRNESAHREPLWVMPLAGRVTVLGAKLLATGIWTTVLAILASAATFFNPQTRAVWTSSGWEYLPLYIALCLIQALTWAAISFFLFSLSRSHLLAVFGAVLAATAIPMLSVFPTLARTTFYRSLISWNFVTPLSPLGVIPMVFGLQGVGLLGVMLISFAGGILVRKKLAEWQGVRLRSGWIVFWIGLVLTLGATVGTVYELKSWKAPFEVYECPPWPMWSRPYIWDAKGMLIFHPGRYTVMRTRPHLLPPWAEELARSREMFQLPQERCSLVALYPKGQGFPPELRGVAVRFQPLLKRAVLWGVEPKMVVVPISFFEYTLEATKGFLFLPLDTVSSSLVRGVASSCAWALTAGLGIELPERAYLILYLLAGIGEEKALLEDLHRGKYPQDLPRFELSAEAIERILMHWRMGEEMGHENYISMLLQKGRKG